jgi:hypothetical protein
MIPTMRHKGCVALVWACLAACAITIQGQDLEKKATWSIPTAEQVKAQLDAGLQPLTLDDATRTQIAALWLNADGSAAAVPPEEWLDRVAASLALVNGDARQVVEFCGTQTQPFELPTFAILQDAQQPGFVRTNLKLLYGRWLAQHDCYDEALAQLQDLQPTDVVDPAALLFYQALCYHRMPDKSKCEPLVARLLENKDQIPRRFARVSELIQTDIAPLERDSLDEVARLMDEVKRRLALQRAGTRVREQQEEVVAKLDKLIKKIEEEQQQQQQQAAAGSLQPSQPAQDSRPMQGLGPGDIDPHKLGSKSGWGNLPPAERQEALQQIGQDLPAHYREVIEEYFRKLAREESGQ